MSNALDVTDSTWESAVLQSHVPVLVDFWAEWCAPCRAMGPSVDKLASEFIGTSLSRNKIYNFSKLQLTEGLIILLILFASIQFLYFTTRYKVFTFIKS